MILISETVVSRPICPTLIHDEGTKVVVCVLGIVVCLYAIGRAIRYFNGF